VVVAVNWALALRNVWAHHVVMGDAKRLWLGAFGVLLLLGCGCDRAGENAKVEPEPIGLTELSAEHRACNIDSDCTVTDFVRCCECPFPVPIAVNTTTFTRLANLCVNVDCSPLQCTTQTFVHPQIPTATCSEGVCSLTIKR